MYNRKLIAVLLVMIFAFIGCAMQGAKPITEMTPKERVTWMYGVYNSQYEDYKSLAANPDALSDAQKEVMREKKKVLTKVYPMIKLYDGYVTNGAIPDREVEANIVSLLNQLLMM